MTHQISVSRCLAPVWYDQPCIYHNHLILFIFLYILINFYLQKNLGTSLGRAMGGAQNTAKRNDISLSRHSRSVSAGSAAVSQVLILASPLSWSPRLFNLLLSYLPTPFLISSAPYQLYSLIVLHCSTPAYTLEVLVLELFCKVRVRTRECRYTAGENRPKFKRSSPRVSKDSHRAKGVNRGSCPQ